MRKPDWLKVPLPSSRAFTDTQGLLGRLALHSVCQEARCPNIGECFGSGTAAFLILGNLCTRNCRYCNVRHGRPDPVDESEPGRLAEAARTLGLRHIVITSVTRDDLPDGGAGQFARCIDALRREVAGCRVEVLIPDFQGDRKALETILSARPDVLNHNLEVTRGLFAELRPQGDYRRSLDLLRHAAEASDRTKTKSGFMIGLGEDRDGILSLLDDLAAASCAHLTIGQYLQPSRHHWPVAKFYAPEEFEELRQEALGRGFRTVVAGPLVRSSYRAAEYA
ncbi:MAG TPA: lipoyl synthase [Syntrophales bacterium]|nr:lipoyl synthase [Syntrophales bacterium]